MKKLVVLFFLCWSCEIWAQQPDSLAYLHEDCAVSNFKLYPTQNMWNFLKLDTRTGKIWQVQYSVEEDGYRHETELNDEDLTFGQNSKPGRFCLHPTLNIHNFILLDCEDGRVWQVQWSFGRSSRGILKIQPAQLLDYEVGDVMVLEDVELRVVENLGEGRYLVVPAHFDSDRRSWQEAKDYCAALGEGWTLPTYEQYLVIAKGKIARFWTCEVEGDCIYFYDPNNAFDGRKQITNVPTLKMKFIPIKEVRLH